MPRYAENSDKKTRQQTRQQTRTASSRSTADKVTLARGDPSASRFPPIKKPQPVATSVSSTRPSNVVKLPPLLNKTATLSDDMYWVPISTPELSKVDKVWMSDLPEDQEIEHIESEFYPKKRVGEQSFLIKLDNYNEHENSDQIYLPKSVSRREGTCRYGSTFNSPLKLDEYSAKMIFEADNNNTFMGLVHIPTSTIYFIPSKQNGGQYRSIAYDHSFEVKSFKAKDVKGKSGEKKQERAVMDLGKESAVMLTYCGKDKKITKQSEATAHMHAVRRLMGFSVDSMEDVSEVAKDFLGFSFTPFHDITIRSYTDSNGKPVNMERDSHYPPDVFHTRSRSLNGPKSPQKLGRSGQSKFFASDYVFMRKDDKWSAYSAFSAIYDVCDKATYGSDLTSAARGTLSRSLGKQIEITVMQGLADSEMAKRKDNIRNTLLEIVCKESKNLPHLAEITFPKVHPEVLENYNAMEDSNRLVSNIRTEEMVKVDDVIAKYTDKK